MKKNSHFIIAITANWSYITSNYYGGNFMTLDQYRIYLLDLKRKVKPFSPDDDAAYEHMAEIESIIQAIDEKSDVKRAAYYVGIPYLVTSAGDQDVAAYVAEGLGEL
jgi:hypothetical protein